MNWITRRLSTGSACNSPSPTTPRKHGPSSLARTLRKYRRPVSSRWRGHAAPISGKHLSYQPMPPLAAIHTPARLQPPKGTGISLPFRQEVITDKKLVSPAPPRTLLHIHAQVPDMNDADLLKSFAATRSDQAFRALIDRYLNLVYAACRRQLRDGHPRPGCHPSRLYPAEPAGRQLAQ